MEPGRRSGLQGGSVVARGGDPGGCPTWTLPRSRRAGQIEAVRGRLLRQRIVEDAGAAFAVAEGLAQDFQKRRVGVVVGPHREDAAGLQEIFQPPQAIHRIEIGVRGIEQLRRRMVDVQQHGSPAPAGLRRVESVPARQGEEIGVQIGAARIVGQFPAVGHEPAPVPIDHGFQGLDDDQPRDLREGQRFGGGIAQPEPADDDVPIAAFQRAQSVPRKLGFGHIEQAGHEVFAVELDLVGLRAVQREHAATL